MSEGKFQVVKAHKMLDWLEGEVTEWANNQITEWFGCDDVTELTEEQVQEIVDASEDDNLDGWLSLGLRNVVNQWQNEHDIYLI